MDISFLLCLHVSTFLFSTHSNCVSGPQHLAFWLFFFFFFLKSQFSRDYALFSGSHACLQDPQTSFFNKTFIKNESYGTIYTFKNYFATVFSIFSFQQNKRYPNESLVFCLLVQVACSTLPKKCSLFGLLRERIGLFISPPWIPIYVLDQDWHVSGSLPLLRLGPWTLFCTRILPLPD